MKRIAELWIAACSSWPFWGVHRDTVEATGPYLNKYRVGGLVLAGSLALLFGLGVGATAVDAWDGASSTSVTSACGTSTFPATGQTTSYGNSTNTQLHDVTVKDDGFVRAGGALRYVDNGDGTITDLNTRLMWEKKIQDGGLHDWGNKYLWSCAVACAPMQETIWDWLDFVNTDNGGLGFAGYNDWRIPNVKELMSIFDYAIPAPGPAVDAAFNNGVAGFCDALSCSRTQSGFYWSSTTNAAFAGGAWDPNFGYGGVFVDDKFIAHFVRAVRGGCVP